MNTNSSSQDSISGQGSLEWKVSSTSTASHDQEDDALASRETTSTPDLKQQGNEKRKLSKNPPKKPSRRSSIPDFPPSPNKALSLAPQTSTVSSPPMPLRQASVDQIPLFDTEENPLWNKLAEETNESSASLLNLVPSDGNILDSSLSSPIMPLRQASEEELPPMDTPKNPLWSPGEEQNVNENDPTKEGVADRISQGEGSSITSTVQSLAQQNQQPLIPRRQGSIDDVQLITDPDKGTRDPSGNRSEIDETNRGKISRLDAIFEESNTSCSIVDHTPDLDAVAGAMQSYVMDRISSEMQKKLSLEEWNEIFSLAAESQESPDSLLDEQQSFSSTATLDDRSTTSSDSLDRREAAQKLVASGHRGHTKREFRSSLLGTIGTRVPTSNDLTADTDQIQRFYDTAIPTTTPPSTDAPDANRHSQRHVSFSTAEIRYYEQILEVHPCTSSGPSLGLGWNYDTEDVVTLTVDELESLYEKRRNNELLLSSYARVAILEEFGFSGRQMAKSVKRVTKSKRQREKTNRYKRAQNVEYIVEKAKRKVGKSLGLRDDLSIPQERGLLLSLCLVSL